MIARHGAHHNQRDGLNFALLGAQEGGELGILLTMRDERVPHVREAARIANVHVEEEAWHVALQVVSEWRADMQTKKKNVRQMKRG